MKIETVIRISRKKRKLRLSDIIRLAEKHGCEVSIKLVERKADHQDKQEQGDKSNV